MKAPDKIYVAKSLIKTPYGNEWSPTPYISRENTEYIRRDALLEWASDRLGMVSDLGFDDGDVEHGYIRALQDLIDKLNSM